MGSMSLISVARGGVLCSGQGRPGCRVNIGKVRDPSALIRLMPYFNLMRSPPGPLDPAEDARLVEWCLSGDHRAWESLVHRHERLVYGVARRYRLSHSDLEDVFQDVFAALVRGLPRLRDGRALCAWLVSTTDRIARATALRTRRESALGTPAVGTVENVAADRPPLEAALETLEEQALIRLALASLPEACNRLLVALYYEDPAPAYADLARRFGIPVGSLGPTRARCMERLRRILKTQFSDSVRIRTRSSPTSADERSSDERSRRGFRQPPALAGDSG
jgi:RNA polymerase sigma factor (sigma-70 family)